jgi:hypothetical protein
MELDIGLIKGGDMRKKSFKITVLVFFLSAAGIAYAAYWNGECTKDGCGFRSTHQDRKACLMTVKDHMERNPGHSADCVPQY